MKIDRRKPVNLFRVKRKWRLRDHIPLTTVAKYATLTVVGILLFRAGQARALAERGYEALGGEVFALFLPVLYWMVARIVKDTLTSFSHWEGPCHRHNSQRIHTWKDPKNADRRIDI